MRLTKNIKYACEGLASFFRTEKNGRIQGVIAVLVIGMGTYLRLALSEWIWLLLCIAMVLCLEMINSAVEKVCNLISTDYNKDIKIIKDICAGAVLLASVIAAIIGGMIFIPRLFALI